MENLERKSFSRFWFFACLIVWSTILLILLTSYVVTTVILDSRSHDALVEAKTCRNGKKWMHEDAVLYYPEFLKYHYKSEDQQLRNMSVGLLVRGIFRDYNTVIIKCPSTDPANYLELVSYLADYVKESLSVYGSAPSVWFQIGNGNGSACIELANAANKQQAGTVTGMIITVHNLIEIPQPYITSESNLNSNSMEEWFEIRFARTYGNWEGNGLKAGLIISPFSCFDFDEEFPKNFMMRFERKFFVEETPKSLVVAHGIPFLTLSDNYKSCRNYFESKFDLELVLPRKIVPKAAFSRPYCLL